MKRIMIIGSPGSGKSTMARRLSDILNIPAVHLDKLWWKPNWTESSKEEFDIRLTTELNADSWIIDGNYSRTMDARLEKADTVILLDFPRHICLIRALKRIITTHGRVRPDMGAGCPERFDFEFIKYIWNFKPPVLTNTGGKNIYVIHNNKELNDFYQGIIR